MVLPALVKGKEYGRRAKCLSNLHQLGLAFVMYAGDNNDKVASNGNALDGGDPQNPRWVQGHMRHDATVSTDPFNPDLLTNPHFAQYSPYLSAASIYKCPSDQAGGLIKGQMLATVRSYSMNMFIGWDGTYFPTLDFKDYPVFHKTSGIRGIAPSDLFVFADTNPESICWPFFGVFMQESSYFMYPTALHQQRGLFSFADGHAAVKRWEDARTISPGKIDFHSHAQFSPNNRDIAWLQQHVNQKREIGPAVEP